MDPHSSPDEDGEEDTQAHSCTSSSQEERSNMMLCGEDEEEESHDGSESLPLPASASASEVSLIASTVLKNAHKGLILVPVKETPPSSFLSKKSIVLHQHFTDSQQTPCTTAASKTVDLDAPNKPISIYHLLLDAQLELSSDGDRIVCSKSSLPTSSSGAAINSTSNSSSDLNIFTAESTAYPPNKRKKSSSTSTGVIPPVSSPTMNSNMPMSIDKSRSAILSFQETALNSGEPARIARFFEEHCHPQCVFQSDLSSLGARHGLFIYREIHGVQGIAAYFVTSLQAVPDAITLYWQIKNEKIPGTNEREIQAKTLMVGQQVYGVDVLDDEEAHFEQENIELVVAGLTSLASGGKLSLEGSGSGNGESDSVMTVTEDSVSSSIDNSYGHSILSKSSDGRSTAVSNHGEIGVPVGLDVFSHTAAFSATSSEPTPTIGRKRTIRSLNDMNILVAQGSVSFQRGKPLQTSVAVNYAGITTWTLDKDRKIIKIRFVLT